MKKVIIPVTEPALDPKNLDTKKFSKKDMLDNFTKYMEEGGFDFNDTPYDRLKSYINWLDKEIV